MHNINYREVFSGFNNFISILSYNYSYIATFLAILGFTLIHQNLCHTFKILLNLYFV